MPNHKKGGHSSSDPEKREASLSNLTPYQPGNRGNPWGRRGKPGKAASKELRPAMTMREVGALADEIRAHMPDGNVSTAVEQSALIGLMALLRAVVSDDTTIETKVRAASKLVDKFIPDARAVGDDGNVDNGLEELVKTIRRSEQAAQEPEPKPDAPG